MATHAAKQYNAGQAEHHGPTTRTYVTVALVLFLITVIEITASFMTRAGLPEWSQIVTLLILATIKGSLVLLFFMHLRFDSRWFSFLFSSAMVLAVFCIVTFIILFAYKASFPIVG